MATPLKQASFIGGEIDPSLHARTELERYSQAVALCKNWIVRPTGGAVNRPGTRYLANTPLDSPCRLIPFVFSQAASQSYVLEFDHNVLRFYALDPLSGRAGIVLSGGIPYVLPTPYSVFEAQSLCYAQSADVLFLASHYHPPMELRRLGHTSWVLTPMVFTRSIGPPTNVTASQPAIPAPDDTHPLRDVEYIVTAVRKLPNGDGGDESLGSVPTTNAFQDYPDRKDIIVAWNLPTGVTMAEIERFNVYKGRQGAHGYIGYTRGVLEFHDKAYAPVMNDTAPRGRNPFAAVDDYPSVIAFFQQRLALANSINNPTTIWMSRTGALRNFDVSIPAKDDDAITLALASLQVDEIRSLIPMKTLLPLTSSAEWSVKGTGDNRVVTPTALVADPHSYEGSEAPHATAIGHAVMFASRGGGVRSLTFDWQADGYATKDLSILANHLFQGHAIVSWAYASKPFKCLWAVREDGRLLGLTYVREHEVWAWHQHETDGLVEQIAVIPEGAEDGVYICVERNGQRFIERMAARMITDQRDGCFLDSALSYDGVNHDAIVVMALNSAAGWTAGTLMPCSCSSPIFLASDVGSQIWFSHPDGGLVCDVVAYDNANVVQVRVKSDVPLELQGITTAGWAVARRVVSGLDHLEGRTVRACADGNAHGEMTVSGGTVALQYHAVVIHVGLPYVSDLIGLPARLDPTTSKVMSHIYLDLLDSRGLQVGSIVPPGMTQSLYPQTSRTVEDNWNPGAMRSGLEEISVASSYGTPAQWIVRQTEPLPATVRAVIPKVEASRVS